MNTQTLKFMNEELQRKVKSYISRYSPTIGSSNFNHITNNLLTVLFGIPFRIEIRDPIEEIERSYLMHKDALDLYLSLIEKFPDFGRAEFSSENGFFPGIPNKGNGSMINYVNEASKRLEQIANSSEMSV